MSVSTSTIVPNRFPMVRITWAGLTRPVHEGIAAQFKHIIAQWEARGGQRAYEIRSWWGYATRPNDAGAHPRGVGIDINPAENPMVAKRTPCPSDMPQWFIDLWLAQGFGHGGYWRSKCDAMHQSKLLSEGGNGRIYEHPSGLVTTVPTTPTTPKIEEEDMAGAYSVVIPKATTKEDGTVVPGRRTVPLPGTGVPGGIWVSLSCDYAKPELRVAEWTNGRLTGVWKHQVKVTGGREPVKFYKNKGETDTGQLGFTNPGPEDVTVLVECGIK